PRRPADLSPRPGARRSSPPAGPACRSDDVTGAGQLVQEIVRTIKLLDLHPAAPQLPEPMRVRSGGSHLSKVGGEFGGGAVRSRLVPGVVRLDDVDMWSQLHDAIRREVRVIAVKPMR